MGQIGGYAMHLFLWGIRQAKKNLKWKRTHDTFCNKSFSIINLRSSNVPHYAVLFFVCSSNYYFRSEGLALRI